MKRNKIIKKNVFINLIHRAGERVCGYAAGSIHPEKNGVHKAEVQISKKIPEDFLKKMTDLATLKSVKEIETPEDDPPYRYEYEFEIEYEPEYE